MIRIKLCSNHNSNMMLNRCNKNRIAFNNNRNIIDISTITRRTTIISKIHNRIHNNPNMIRSTVNHHQSLSSSASLFSSLSSLQIEQEQLKLKQEQEQLQQHPSFIKSTFRNKLEQERIKAYVGGGIERMKKQHNQGKLIARERLELLYDHGTFVELDIYKAHRCIDFNMVTKQYPGDGVIIGYGNINNKPVYAFSQDFTIFGGTLSETNAQKILKVMDMALRYKTPIIGLNDSGGARIQEGVDSLGGYAEIFQRNVDCSGIIPQISCIMGPCAGGAVYSPAMTDFIFMVEQTSYMFVTGPDVVKTVTNENITKETLGGATVHTAISGVAHNSYSNDITAIRAIRRLLHFIPHHNIKPTYNDNAIDNNMNNNPLYDSPNRLVPQLNYLIPDDPNIPYDMKDIIKNVVDYGDIMEIMPHYATNIITAFSKMNHMTVGIIGNNPISKGGCLDINCSVKASRFIRYCNTFHIPIITFVDVPGFLPGIHQEHAGIITNGAKLLFAYAEASIPKLTVITRKAYGGAYDVMSSKHLRGDSNYAYPGAEIAVMGAKGAIEILYGSKLSSNEIAQHTKEYIERFANPMIVAQRGFIDDIINPEDTRKILCRDLQIFRNKDVPDHPYPRKHSCIPL